MKITGKMFVFFSLCALAFPAHAQMQKSFPELRDVPESLRLASKPTLAIDKDGNWIVNGKMRFMLGMQYGTLFGRGGFQKIPGGDPENAWFAEKAPSYETCQRVGFDTICSGNPMGYMKELFPAFTYDLIRPSQDGCALEPGLPVLMDYTCAPWCNGRAANRKGEDFYHPEIDGQLPDDAITPRKENVWVPYCVFHPDGQKVYRAMFADGAKIIRKYKVPAVAYELFNEPMYADQGPYARKCFVPYLKKQYGTVGKMNELWRSSYKSFEEASRRPNLSENIGLYVDYLKFLEDGIVNICRIGEEAIREIDPSARFCFQVKGLWHYRRITGSAMNLYKINQLMQIVTVSTGGGVSHVEGSKAAAARAVDTPANLVSLPDGVMQRHFYRALADGKPMQNQEMYVGKEYDEILSKIWLDYARGSNATYLFSWGSGVLQWRPRTVEGGKKNAEWAPYTLLNPYAVPPGNLPAIYQAKKEIFSFGRFFLPRNRHVKRQVAVLFSYPTERASGATGYQLKNEFPVYGGALDFAHYPIDVLFEEQLPEKRQDRYKVIVAAGIRNTYRETVPALLDFVKKGGVLILGREFMPEDEYGRKNPAWGNTFKGLKFKDDFDVLPGKCTPEIAQTDNLKGALTLRTTRLVSAHPGWTVLAKDGGHPVLLQKKFGKGSIYLLTAEMPDYALASMLGSVLERHNIRQEAVLKRYDEKDLPVNVELHAARQNGKTVCFLYNYDAFPKLVTFTSEDLKKNPYMVDLAEKKLVPVKDGKALLRIPAQKRMVLGIGPAGAFDEFGPFAPVTEKSLIDAYRRDAAEQKAKLERERKAAFRYFPDPARTYTLDLRKYANSAFTDRTIPGDGKGGWTDQGSAHSLNGVPWGKSEFLGVPCDIIRFDENEDRTCIILKSKSSKIPFPESVTLPVNDRVNALYFFHTAAWVPKTAVKAMDYEITYASGRVEKIPVVSQKNIWDWYSIRDREPLKYCAWKNLESHGFYCIEWKNPHPADMVRSITLRSACGEIIPFVIAVSAEKYQPAAETYPVPEWILYPLGGFRAVKEKDLYGIRASGTEKPYSGFVANAKKNMFPVTEKLLKKGVFKMEIRGGLDKFGARKDGQMMMLSLCRSGAYGKNLFAGKRVWIRSYLPGKRIGTEFQEISIPLKDLLPDPGKVPKEGLNQLYFRAEGPRPESGIEFRNVRVVLPAE